MCALGWTQCVIIIPSYQSAIVVLLAPLPPLIQLVVVKPLGHKVSPRAVTFGVRHVCDTDPAI